MHPAPADHVVFTGPVPDVVLSELYRRARAFAYVPLTEGYGLPPLEAMRAGIPTVVSDEVPSVHDLGAPEPAPARIVDPLDVDDIARGSGRRPDRRRAAGRAGAPGHGVRGDPDMARRGPRPHGPLAVAAHDGRQARSRRLARRLGRAGAARWGRVLHHGDRAGPRPSATTSGWRWWPGAATSSAGTTWPGGAAVRGAVPASRPGRLVFEQLRLGSVLRSMGVQVHHGPHYTMPSRSPVPCAVTIHDCTFFDHPEWHVRSKAAFFRRAIRRAARQAAVLICVSQVTEDRLRAWCDVRAPVVVAPHGVDHRSVHPARARRGRRPCRCSPRWACRSTGRWSPSWARSSLARGWLPLVAAFDQVARRHPDAVLVLGGQTGWGMAETERALAAARHPERIVRTGYLPDEAVPALLRQAAVVAYPALEEGFGLPALEALACGAPLVTTEGTAMAEMAGGAALLVPPGDVAGLADALGTALQEGRATARRSLGIAVAGERTWEASVALHRRAYALALAASQ